VADLEPLATVLRGLPVARVAVSGGVDSMTLAHAVHGILGNAAAMVHAISPAVPPTATERVRRHAARHGWVLAEIDAGEFDDPAYLANPINRCFFCKRNLYGTIAARFGGPILSGTNLDDLGDYRPGLRAATEHAVRHPFVEASIDKAGVRALARHMGLDDLAELPASPCMSSRIRTGLAVTEQRLGGVLAIENAVAERLGANHTIRCRVLEDGVEIQLGNQAMERWRELDHVAALAELRVLSRQHGLGTRLDVAPYRRGSAFVRREANVV
jgi:uncharacterized protein